MNKTGSVLDIIFVLVGALVLGIVTILAFFIMSSVIGAFHTNPAIDNSTLEGADYFSLKFVSIFDFAFLFIIVGLTLTSVIGAALTDTHPVFFGISLILLIVTIFGAMIIEYIYSEIALTSTILPFSSQFTVIPFFMDNLPFYVLGMAVLIIVMTFSKRSQALG